MTKYHFSVTACHVPIANVKMSDVQKITHCPKKRTGVQKITLEDIQSGEILDFSQISSVPKIGQKRFVSVQKMGHTFKLIFHNNGGMSNGNKRQRISEELSAGEHEPIVHGDAEHDTARLENNISRARSRIREYALCNEFTYFCTLTLAPDKVPYRDDLPTVIRHLGQFFGNYQRRHAPGFAYVLVPERHKKGGYHFHGLVKGIPQPDLIRNEHGYLEWVAFSRRFGFVNIEPVRSLVRVAAYVTKYVTKDLAATPHAKGEHLFYASKGLSRAEPLCCFDTWAGADYEAEWCGITWADPERRPRLCRLLEVVAARGGIIDPGVRLELERELRGEYYASS